MLKKILLSGVLLLSAIPFYAQTSVVTGVMHGKDYGVVYSLPKTAINVTIVAEKTSYTPGELAKYANRFLQLNDVKQEAYANWKFIKADIALIGTPDPDKSYFVKLKDKSVAPNMELTSSGVIKSINLPFSTFDKKKTEVVTIEEETTIDPRRYFTEEILMANSTAKVAELVAKEIFAIRESRNSLLRGEYEETPSDGEYLKILLKKMDEQEKALLSLFIGTTITKKVDNTIGIDITGDIQNQVIARFSSKVGVVDYDDLIGEPIYFSLKDLKSVNLLDTGKGKKKEEGIAYNLPGRGYVEVSFNNKIVSKGELSITQFGIVEFLAPALFNKKSTIQVYFDETTGGLLKVNQSES